MDLDILFAADFLCFNVVQCIGCNGCTMFTQINPGSVTLDPKKSCLTPSKQKKAKLMYGRVSY